MCREIYVFDSERRKISICLKYFFSIIDLTNNVVILQCCLFIYFKTKWFPLAIHILDSSGKQLLLSGTNTKIHNIILKLE